MICKYALGSLFGNPVLIVAAANVAVPDDEFHGVEAIVWAWKVLHHLGMRLRGSSNSGNVLGRLDCPLGASGTRS